MRKVIVSEFLTLDGVMESPGGEPGHPHGGWVFDFMTAEQMSYKLTELLEAESLLIGRLTYESFAETWPQRAGEFADKINAMPKHVVSTSLQNTEWRNCTVIKSDVAQQVTQLKREQGGPILVAGSRTLVHTLMEHALIDEYRLMVFPVMLGSGLRLFPETSHKTDLHLANIQTFVNGVLVQTYRPATR